MHSWNLYMKSQKIWPFQPFDANVSQFQTGNNGTPPQTFDQLWYDK